MVKPRSSDLCVPRWATARTPGRETLGSAVATAAEMLGTPLMPWQRIVADVGLELLDDGRPAYRSVGFTVPRQSGKTTLVLSWEIDRAVGWAATLGQPQRILYSAQTGNDARKKLIEDQVPLLERHKRVLGIRQILRGMGAEGVVWHNGSRIGLLHSTEDSGHGKTVDLGIKDELFADADLRRDQALIPAMATRPFAQSVTASTMGTADSLALNTEVAQGRAAAETGRNTGIAYFEWSADPDDDPADPATWWRCMPALGRTIGLEVVEHAYASMKLGEFKRAFLNIPTTTDERVIPAVVWDLVNVPSVEATAEVFALDVDPDRSAAAIVAAGVGPILELVDYRAGVGWVVARCKELADRYRVKIALDANGPAGSFVVDLERAGVPILPLKPQDVVRAAGRFYDVVVNEKIKIRRDTALDNAVAGAAKRPVGDAWVWGRKSSRSDISPLVAATIALASLEQGAPVIPFAAYA